MLLGSHNTERVSKVIFFICTFTVIIAIFTLINTVKVTINDLHELSLAKERIPNQQLYRSILTKDVHLLNVTTPEISPSADVIVLVCSHPDDFKIRNEIRSTWANKNNSEAIENKSISVIFLIGYTSSSLQYEKQKYKDILQVEVEDTYLNLVYKLLAAYRWIHSNYPDKYLFKIDADVIVNLNEIKSLLNESTQSTIQCHINRSVPPVRNSKSRWYIPWYVWSERYLLDYCNGPLYLVGPTALKKLLIDIENVQVFEVEDAFFTGVLTNLNGIQIKAESRIWNRKKLSQPCINGRPTVIGFPLHHKKIDRKKYYKELKSIRCQNALEYFYSHYIDKNYE